MRLTPDVALVGGGDTCFNISSPLDCHLYLLDGGTDLALIDAGVGGTAGNSKLILQNIEADGFDLTQISKLFLTHYHADHAGGAAEMRRLLGCNVHGSPICADVLIRGDEEAISLPFAKSSGFYPADYRLEPCETLPTLVEGATIQVGRLTVTVFDTPGHSAGHVSLLVSGGDRTYLVSGDLVFYGGTIVAQNIPDCSIQEYAASTIKMADVEFDALLPGHFTISLRDGKRHVDTAAAQFRKLSIPRNAV